MKRIALAVSAAALLIGAGVATLLVIRNGERPAEAPASKRVDLVDPDPFAYRQAADAEFLRRGRDGSAHVLYEKSPGGVEATAARVARFRRPIERAAEREGVSPETLAAVVFLESAGRPDVIAGPDPESAVGLGQILPETAVDLLDMSVTLPRSKRLTRLIARERLRALGAPRRPARRAAEMRVGRLVDRRKRVDERFDPRLALEGAARYLALAEHRFGREDLALASYHMGVGNLEDVIQGYLAPAGGVVGPTGAAVEEHGLSFARLYFDSSPLRHTSTYRKLRGFGDDSRHYLFKVEAARQILRLHREDGAELRRLIELHQGKSSAEDVLRPPGETPEYAEPGDLRSAYEDRELIALSAAPRRLGYRIDPRMGGLAGRLGEPRSLYRGLRPEGLATVLHIARQVRRIAGAGTLRLTSTVRDAEYNRMLAESSPTVEAGYPLHATGFAFDIARDLHTERQKRALAFALERLRALAVVDYVLEPQAIHVTAGPDAGRFLEPSKGLLPAPPSRPRAAREPAL